MKKLNFVIIFIIAVLCMPSINALSVNDSGVINKKGVSFKSSPNEGGNKVLNTLDTGDKVTLLDTNLVASNNGSCSTGYYRVSFYWESYNKKTYQGYVCADNITFSVDTNKYAEEFRNSNIPEIYWEKLTILKDAHPNWKFTGYNTGLDWNAATSEEANGSSAIQKSDPIYLSLADFSYNAATNTYNQLPEGGGWYYANKQTVAYYMDPRNFMDEIGIFMFENLSYNSNYQTLEVVQKVLANTDLYNYAGFFMDAATYNGNSISPVMLAALSRQEVVLSNGKISNSANGSKGYYNFYNLGAWSSCANAIDCAINFASGYGGEYKTYDRPWSVDRGPGLAIAAGAQYIANGYINVGQNTLYFKKFNVTNNGYGNYSHQYQTNIQAPYTEASKTANSYASIPGLLDNTIEFIIPVYNNMPASTTVLPTSVDQSAVEQAKQTQNNVNTSTSITDGGYSVKGEYLTNISINETASDMLAKLGGNATITRDGKVISGTEKLGTADKVTIDNSTFKIIVYGDTNGDGQIDAIDFVKVYKYIMGSSSLSGSFKEAADINKDGKVDAIDFVKLYKML